MRHGAVIALLLAACAVAPTTARANCSTFNGTVSSCLGRIESIEIGDANYLLVDIETAGPLSCSLFAGYWRVSRSAIHYAEWHQAFLVMLTTQQTGIFESKPNTTHPTCELQKMAVWR